MDIKSIQTYYRGFRFRSRTEARWAMFFDLMGFYFEYEKEGYDLPCGKYLPDFYIPEINTFVEIKGGKFKENEIQKCKELCAITGKYVMMIDGVPRNTPFPTVLNASHSYNDVEVKHAVLWSGKEKILSKIITHETNIKRPVFCDNGSTWIRMADVDDSLIVTCAYGSANEDYGAHALVYLYCHEAVERVNSYLSVVAGARFEFDEYNGIRMPKHKMN